MPLMLASEKAIDNRIRRHSNRYKYFEIWIEYLDDAELNSLLRLIKRYPNRIIVVFRRLNLERMKVSLERRLEILEGLSNRPVIVDLDVSVQRKEIAHVNKHKLKLKTILSYHNYKLTPPEKELEAIVKYMGKQNAYIYKIATQCTKESDALRLISLLLQLRSRNKKAIVLGMGIHGKITRIFGALWGNEISFAPVKLKESSAPGQITLNDLTRVLRIIG